MPRQFLELESGAGNLDLESGLDSLELESSTDDGTDLPLLNHDTMVTRLLSVLSYLISLGKGD